MWELELNAKEALKNYSIVELKTFMDAVKIAIYKATVGSEDKRRLVYTERAIEDLMCSKVNSFVNGL